MVYNSAVRESREVAEYYAKARNVPAKQIVGFKLPENEIINRKDYREKLETPLREWLEKEKIWTMTAGADGRRQVTASKIRYAVLCFGVPLKIAQDDTLHEPNEGAITGPMRRSDASVDSELASLPLSQAGRTLVGAFPNPAYANTNAATIHPTNGVLMVARLDGPTAALARGLVDKAMDAQTNGLWGRAYFDTRGLREGSFKMGDDAMRMAMAMVKRLGIETVVDENPGTLPRGFPLSQVAFYAGWYDEHVSGPFTADKIEFMPGAFAYHLHSFSAATLRDPKRQWVAPFISKGVTCTMGCVQEPFLHETPDMLLFFARWVGARYSFGEAAYTCQPSLSWQTTVVGDPLYTPFTKTPEQQENELRQRNSRLLEWSYLRVANLGLAINAPPVQVAAFLEQVPVSKQSPVILEKLSDLYAALGKPSSAADALVAALKLETTPMQRLRLLLTAADRLAANERGKEAVASIKDALKDYPNAAERASLYRKVIPIALKAGMDADVTEFNRELQRLGP